MKLRFQLYPKQLAFIRSDAFETLYGGAAGGGKSFVQIVDALVYALKYPGSKQLALRNSFPELRRSLILTSLELYPREIGTYNQSAHLWEFKNGSRLEFGYIANDKDVSNYMSAEYDVIRFDEATHFSDYQYTYMLSRIRGANNFPKRVKASTNPGNQGHAFFKERFVDLGAPMQKYEFESGSRIFIPAKVSDNIFLLDKDPDYIRRLKNLDEDTQRALLDGDWDVFSGQYFKEFRRERHVVRPFDVSGPGWRHYVSIDYGLDMLACLWIAVDAEDYAVVYREVCEPNLIIDRAAARILDAMSAKERDSITEWFAPRDLWNRRQETGVSVADRFAECGIYLSKVSNPREMGWLEVKRRLMPAPDAFGGERPKLQIFDTCTELIRCLPALQHDEKHVNDCATEPHDITHAPDALRYFCDGRPLPASLPVEREEDEKGYEEEMRDVFGY